MMHDERNVFMHMMDEYVQHLIDMGNKSFLARIYGIFSIKTAFFASVDVILMQNTFRYFNKPGLKYKFDLKGSLINRWSKYSIQKC